MGGGAQKILWIAVVLRRRRGPDSDCPLPEVFSCWWTVGKPRVRVLEGGHLLPMSRELLSVLGRDLTKKEGWGQGCSHAFRHLQRHRLPGVDSGAEVTEGR